MKPNFFEEIRMKQIIKWAFFEFINQFPISCLIYFIDTSFIFCLTETFTANDKTHDIIDSNETNDNKEYW